MQLYGKHGIEGVSLRQICVAAGNGNNNAVQYHFGSVDGLIEAILTKYTPVLEFERAQRLARVQAAGAPAIRDLVDVLLRPALDLLDEHGERALARFMLALASTPGAARWLSVTNHLLPISDQILALMGASVPDVPPSLLRERTRLAGLMVLMSIFNRIEPYDRDNRMDAVLVDHAIGMAAASIAAPLPAALRAELMDYRPKAS